jgi:hypothetical protein
VERLTRRGGEVVKDLTDELERAMIEGDAPDGEYVALAEQIAQHREGGGGGVDGAGAEGVAYAIEFLRGALAKAKEVAAAAGEIRALIERREGVLRRRGGGEEASELMLQISRRCAAWENEARRPFTMDGRALKDVLSGRGGRGASATIVYM